MDEKVKSILDYFCCIVGHVMGMNNITQRELAEKIGSTQGDVSKYLSGKHLPSLPMFIKICLALDVPVDMMLQFDIDER